MLFKRREEESWLERIRVHIWPRRSFARSTRYIMYRLRRLRATPHAVALGFAAGVFAAITPFLGTHMIMAVAIAWAVGGSIVAALLGTFVGNPITYPLFWYSTYEVGNLMLRGHVSRRHIDLTEGVFQGSVEHLWPILKPMTLGSIPLGIAAAALSYVLVKPMVEAYQRHRRHVLAAKQDHEAVSTR